MPSKIFCKIILTRIDKAIDEHLRPEQAGFRKGKGCVDQIFTLRNIIEQGIEWNAPLFINFIHFKKAFDSVHHESLWNILKAYGIPTKTVELIKMLYQNFQCSVLLNNSMTEYFQVKTGVRQGCALSSMLFIIVLDWVMRNTTKDKKRGIQWTLLTTLEDLDFADDLALLATSNSHQQEKTDRLDHYSSKVGLAISNPKSKTMSINTKSITPITIKGENLEEVDDFVYLGSMISKENSTSKDIQARLAKARSTFNRMKTIRKSQQFNIKTKIKIQQQCQKCSTILFRMLESNTE